ncbi:hypothetical protein KKB44_00305, partial [Candidatus Micrarchaeota archaeon]|nr:hypothetical protein [Candidatus Micrarchaeota archaeon]
DYVPIVQDPAVWKLWYKGLDLTSEDMASLEFELVTDDDKDISESKGPLYNPGNTQSLCTIYAPYVKVSSGESGSTFSIERDDGGLSTELSDDEFYVAINDADCDTNDDDVVDAAVGAGSIFMRETPSSSNYGVAEYASPGLVVDYEDIGDGDTDFAPPDGGVIVVQEEPDVCIQDANNGGFCAAADDDLVGTLLDSTGDYNFLNAGAATDGELDWDSDAPEWLFAIAEEAGEDFVDYYIFGVDTTGDATFDFVSTAGGEVTSDDDEVLYGHAAEDATFYAGNFGPVSDDDVEMVEEEYRSERGSVFESIDSDSVQFNMAHKLAHAQWFLASAEGTSASSSTTVATLGEGESVEVGGVTVKVVEITEDVGACSGAGAVSCTADMSGVSAVIMPNNAASVEVAVPYAGTFGSLVILDTDAVGVGTLVSVGGDKVNSVTAELLQGSAVDWTAETKVVKEVVQGSKIVVAGKEAEDTLAAASDFVSQLQRA